MKTNSHTFRTAALLILGLFASGIASAQEEPKAPATEVNGMDSIVIPTNTGNFVVSFYPKDDTTTTPAKPRKQEPRDFWAGLDLGFNGYVNKDMGMTMPTGFERFEFNQGKSGYLGFNLIEKGIPIYKHHVVLVTGLGFDFNSYRFKANYNPFETADSTGAYETHDYITNRLRTFYATIPLMLGIDFSKPDKKGLHLAFGVVGGVRFASSMKEKYSEDGVTVKEKTKSDYELNPFRVNAQARLGYGDFSLFANYALTPLFKNNAANPELYPYTFGISFGG